MMEQAEVKIPEELQRRPDGEYMREIQSLNEAEENHALRVKVVTGVGVGLAALLVLLWSRRKRKV